MIFNLIIFSELFFILSVFMMLEPNIIKDKSLLTCIFFLLLICCFIEMHINWLGLFIFIIGLLIITYSSHSNQSFLNPLAKVLVAYYLHWLLTSLFSSVIFTIILSENKLYYLFYLVAGILLYGCLGYIIRPYLTPVLQKYFLLRKTIYFLAIVWFLTQSYQLYNYLYFYPQNFQIQSLFSTLAAILLFVLIVMMLMIYSLYSKKKLQQAQQQTQTAYEEIQIYSHALETSYQDLRAFRHDYNNILLSIQEYINEGDLTGLRDYYHSHLKATQNLVTTSFFRLDDIQNIGLSEIRSILLHKLNYAQVAKITITLEVPYEVLMESIFDTIQLVRLLGILLDNAIEAAQESTTPDLSIAVFKQEGDEVIIIRNTYSASLPKEDLLKKNSLSTKGPDRGLGLQNAAAIVKQEHSLFLETQITDRYYTQMITIHQEE